MSARDTTNALALRSALACGVPELKAAAMRVIEGAIRSAADYGEAARALGVSRRTLERLREQIAALRAR